MPERVKEVALGAGEDGEARELPANRLYPPPVARAVLHANHDPRIGLQETPEERQAKAYPGHLRKVVEVHPQPPVADPLDQAGEEAEDAFVAHVLVVEGRQYQHASAARL